MTKTSRFGSEAGRLFFEYLPDFRKNSRIRWLNSDKELIQTYYC